ncbi:MAG TPA: hypothetical protein VF557_14320 [Jatrophihabitans sp.]|uniref:hypothetical protein n=1 Tax=Jatrophihabitans sp. TaxID=1932789 RepID=UPI002EFE54B1
MTRLERPAASPRRARWLAPVLAAAAAAAVAVAAVAVGVTAVSTSGNGDRAAILPVTQVSTPTLGPTPTPSSTPPAPRPASPISARPAATTTPPAQVAAPLRNGQQADRSQIPWSQVGPGWHLIASTATPKAVTAPLYLVNPIGGRYLISQVAIDSIRAWSPDGRRVLLTGEGAGRFSELELATGQVLRTFTIPGAAFVSYTRPTGQAILVEVRVGKGSAARTTLQRFGTDGRHQRTYPSELPGLGKLSTHTVLYSPDGTELLIGARNGLALLGNDGHLIRTLPAPAEQRECDPIKWWDAATVLTRCTNHVIKSQFFSWPSELFLQPVSGGSPTKLAGASAATPFGVQNAWRYSGGLLLREESGCGPGELDLLRNGVLSKLALPSGIANPPPLHAVAGDVVIVDQRMHCSYEPDPVTLIAVNFVTGAKMTLATGFYNRVVSYPGRDGAARRY